MEDAGSVVVGMVQAFPKCLYSSYNHGKKMQNGKAVNISVAILYRCLLFAVLHNAARTVLFFPHLLQLQCSCSQLSITFPFLSVFHSTSWASRAAFSLKTCYIKKKKPAEQLHGSLWVSCSAFCKNPLLGNTIRMFSLYSIIYCNLTKHLYRNPNIGLNMSLLSKPDSHSDVC